MEEEDELLRKCGTDNPFTVPNGYFDSLTNEVMSRLPEKEKSVAINRKVTVWQKAKPLVYMAAMFAGLLLTIRVIVGTPERNEPVYATLGADNEQMTDEYIEAIMDHSMMDDYTLYQYLTEANADVVYE